jgi:Ca2+-transporting ATPase
MKATALTYLTIVLCQLGNILQRRSRHGLFTRYQFHNKQLWLAMALSLFCVINIIYNPWIAPYFRASSLTLVDWWYAILAAAIFLGIREFQRYSRHHSRKAVHALHPKLSNQA